VEGEPWPTYPKIYRMSAAHEEARELAASPEADVDARVFSATTVRFEGDAPGPGRPHGRVRALRLVEAAGPQERAEAPGDGRGRVLRADLVLLALGFRGPERDGGLFGQLGLELDARGNIARDADFSTGREGVFVAGDAGRGQSLIVWAIAEGRSAAAAVDRYLAGDTTLPAPVGPADRPMTA
jgi:glutamate synthase (NADPH/NADH) small chain